MTIIYYICSSYCGWGIFWCKVSSRLCSSCSCPYWYSCRQCPSSCRCSYPYSCSSSSSCRCPYSCPYSFSSCCQCICSCSCIYAINYPCSCSCSLSVHSRICRQVDKYSHSRKSFYQCIWALVLWRLGVSGAFHFSTYRQHGRQEGGGVQAVPLRHLYSTACHSHWWQSSNRGIFST